jgi:hypothetical protein
MRCRRRIRVDHGQKSLPFCARSPAHTSKYGPGAGFLCSTVREPATEAEHQGCRAQHALYENLLHGGLFVQFGAWTIAA